MLDISLYFIADVNQTGERDFLDVVREAVAGGITAIQLRAANLSDEDYSALALRISAILLGTPVKFFLNDRPHLLELVGAHGVHIGEGPTSLSEAREIIGPDFLLGASAIAPEAIDVEIDYLSVGPVWATTSKADAGPAIGVDETARRVESSAWPMLAIGGITTAKVSELASTGIAGIAVLGEICRAADPRATARAFKAALAN